MQGLGCIYRTPAIIRSIIIALGTIYFLRTHRVSLMFFNDSRDCIVTTAVNCFTSFFSGFVIFTYLGFMSHKQGVHISAVATEGKD